MPGSWASRDRRPTRSAPIPLGRADIKRRGRDVTVLAMSLMVHYALRAAERLARDGIEVEVIDPRSLAPFDEATLSCNPSAAPDGSWWPTRRR